MRALMTRPGRAQDGLRCRLGGDLAALAGLRCQLRTYLAERAVPTAVAADIVLAAAQGLPPIPQRADLLPCWRVAHRPARSVVPAIWLTVVIWDRVFHCSVSRPIRSQRLAPARLCVETQGNQSTPRIY